MPKWKPAEIMIHPKVIDDPIAESLHKRYGKLQRNVPTGRSTDIVQASHVLVKGAPLLKTIEKGKTVVYVGPAGKAVDDFNIPDNRMICPHFSRIKWASNGCFYRCDWCYLKGTYRANQPYIAVRVQYDKMEAQLQKRLEEADGPLLFNSGEMADSLSLDGLTRAAEHFIPWFAKQKKGYLFLLTKSANVNRILDLPHGKHTIVAWSMNAPEVSKMFEVGAPTFKRRLEAALRVQDAGYRVRIRLDPIVPIDGWPEMYARAIDDIFRTIAPERITLGTLRFEAQFYRARRRIVSDALLKQMANMKPMFRDKKFTVPKGNKMVTRTKSGKYSFSEKERTDIFGFAIGEIRKHSKKIPIALCKESAGVWNALGLDLSRCKCVCQLDYADMSKPSRAKSKSKR